MKTITKKEAASRWGVGPSMVSAYVKKGMPVTRSGRINWAAANAWREANISPERSGSYHARHRTQADISNNSEVSAASDDSRAERRFFYGRGIAHIARCLRDPERIETFGQIAAEAVAITEEDGRNLGKVFAHLVGGWVSDLLTENLGTEYAGEFARELEDWVTANIPYRADEPTAEGPVEAQHE